MSEEQNKSSAPVLHQYFAIASMINPTSLAGRNIVKIQSRPAQIIDYQLIFFGQSGMAAAKYKKGASFHGVIHTLTQENMLALDKIELTYNRAAAKARLYDGTIIDCTVYLEGQQAKDFNPNNLNNPPSQRYIDIIVQGCQHFGVKQEYIDHLRTIKATPRPKVQEFKKLATQEGLQTWQMSVVEKGNGQNDGPLYATLNGKVLQMIADRSEKYFDTIKNLFAGKHIEIGLSKVLYDPKYGMKNSIEEFTQEHRNYIQHTFCGPMSDKIWKVVALLKKQ